MLRVKKVFMDLLYQQITAVVTEHKVCRISVPEIVGILNIAIDKVCRCPQAAGEEGGELFIKSMKVRTPPPSLLLLVFPCPGAG